MTAEVLDLSVSGAMVAVADHQPQAVGTRAKILLGGAAGMVIVRRATRGPDGRSIYGIQFLTLDPALHLLVAELLTGDRGYLAERWTRAT